MNIATFAAGCFWGVQSSFDKVPGVLKTTVGYTGGNLENPTYQQVCMGNTGHAEAIEIEFDPAVVSYEQLLRHFWSQHNPTTPNRQGPDVGAQYRSAVFVHNLEQAQIAEKLKNELDAQQFFKAPIVTQIATAGIFYRAEEYHQHYYLKRGEDSCST
jgi:peptide-methionine (S)-S-oxide reductase